MIVRQVYGEDYTVISRQLIKDALCRAGINIAARNQEIRTVFRANGLDLDKPMLAEKCFEVGGSWGFRQVSDGNLYSPDDIIERYEQFALFKR